MLRIRDFLPNAGVLLAHVVGVSRLIEGQLRGMLPSPFVLFQRKAAALVFTHGREFTTEILCHVTRSSWWPRATLSCGRGPRSILFWDQPLEARRPPDLPLQPAGGSRTA